MNEKFKMIKIYLMVVAFLDFMGLGVVIAIFPHMLFDGNLLPVAWGNGLRITLLGIFLAVYPAGQFFGASILGKLSDMYGRKRLMIISLLGTLFGFIMSIISIYYNMAVLLFLSRLLTGFFAGNVAIAQASMSDISAEHEKAKNLGSIQIAMGLAWVFGPPMGGWLSTVSIWGLSGFITSFFAMVILFVLIITYTILFYQDTLSKNTTRQKIQIASSILQISGAFKEEELRVAFLAWGVFVAGWWLFEAFLPVYLVNKFNFSSGEIGNFLASMGATYALFQYLVVNRVISKFRPETLVRNALLVSVLSIFGIAFVSNIFQLHIVITLFVMSMGFVLPGIIMQISSLVNNERQGEVMGYIASIQALSTVLMMIVGGYIDSFGISITIFGGALLMMLSWIFFIINARKNTVSI